MDDVLLGADLGTSGLKLVALDLSGRIVAEAERGYPIERPAPDRGTVGRRYERSADTRPGTVGCRRSGGGSAESGYHSSPKSVGQMELAQLQVQLIQV